MPLKSLVNRFSFLYSMKSYTKKGYSVSFLLHSMVFGGIFLYQLYLIYNLEIQPPPQRISLVAWKDHEEEPEPQPIELDPESEEAVAVEEKTTDGTTEENVDISPMMMEVIERLDVPVDKYQSLGDMIDGFDEMSDQQKAKTLEEAIRQASQYSPESLLGATGYIKDRLGIENRDYGPVVEVEVFESTDHLVPFYRIAVIDDVEHFQELAVDPKGNYVIAKSIPTGEMTAEDKRNLRIFNLTNASPALREMRNISLDLLNKVINSQEEAKRREMQNRR